MNSLTASRRKNSKKPSAPDEPSSRPLKDKCTRSKKAKYRKPNRTPTPCRLEQSRILTQSKSTSYKTQKLASRLPKRPPACSPKVGARAPGPGRPNRRVRHGQNLHGRRQQHEHNLRQ